MVSSMQGGMAIEDVARENPDAILKDPIDIEVGLTDKQCLSMANKLGMVGKSVDQVNDSDYYFTFIYSAFKWHEKRLINDYHQYISFICFNKTSRSTYL